MGSVAVLRCAQLAASEVLLPPFLAKCTATLLGGAYEVVLQQIAGRAARVTLLDCLHLDDGLEVCLPSTALLVGREWPSGNTPGSLFNPSWQACLADA